MLKDLTISYTLNGVKNTLSIDDNCYDNLPYNLADMFVKVINDTDVNPSTIIDEMKLSLNIED